MLLGAHIGLALIVVLCCYLILRRLNYYTAALLQQAIKTAEERKATTLLVAEQLKEYNASTSEALGLKVIEAAAVLVGSLKADLKGIHRRMHLVEGSVALREIEIMKKLDEIETLKKEKG